MSSDEIWCVARKSGSSDSMVTVAMATFDDATTVTCPANGLFGEWEKGDTYDITVMLERPSEELTSL